LCALLQLLAPGLILVGLLGVESIDEIAVGENGLVRSTVGTTICSERQHD
jgi:hypothetical protein